MKWSKPTTITINNYGIGKPVSKNILARCKGIFAIHECQNTGKKTMKSLTHIPTGRAIISISTTGRLYRAVKELEKLDWADVTTEYIPTTFDKDKYTRIMLQYSL